LTPSIIFKNSDFDGLPYLAIVWVFNCEKIVRKVQHFEDRSNNIYRLLIEGMVHLNDNDPRFHQYNRLLISQKTPIQSAETWDSRLAIYNHNPLAYNISNFPEVYLFKELEVFAITDKLEIQTANNHKLKIERRNLGFIISCNAEVTLKYGKNVVVLPSLQEHRLSFENRFEVDNEMYSFSTTKKLSSVFKGLKFAIKGAFSGIIQKDVKANITRHSGTVVALTAKHNYLVVGVNTFAEPGPDTLVVDYDWVLDCIRTQNIETVQTKKRLSGENNRTLKRSHTNSNTTESSENNSKRYKTESKEKTESKAKTESKEKSKKKEKSDRRHKNK